MAYSMILRKAASFEKMKVAMKGWHWADNLVEMKEMNLAERKVEKKDVHLVEQ